jgi:type VI secretion system protein ImpA
VETAVELERAMEACSAVESALDRYCGKTGPSLRQLWNGMEAVRSLTMSWLSQRQALDELETGYSPVMPEPVSMGEPDMWTQPNSIRSREEAYQRLAEAAEYLTRTEPHSPTPYLIRRAITWGSLSLPELMHELVRSEGELADIFRLLQVGQSNSAK